MNNSNILDLYSIIVLLPLLFLLIVFYFLNFFSSDEPVLTDDVAQPSPSSISSVIGEGYQSNLFPSVDSINDLIEFHCGIEKEILRINLKIESLSTEFMFTTFYSSLVSSVLKLIETKRDIIDYLYEISEPAYD